MFLTLKQIPRIFEIGTGWEQTFYCRGKKNIKRRLGVPGPSGQVKQTPHNAAALTALFRNFSSLNF
jgi:hypothetical protein